MKSVGTLLGRFAVAAALAGACMASHTQELPRAGRAEQELVNTIARARGAGCGTMAGTTSPLQWMPALASAAARVARGDQPMQAARAAGFRASRIYQVSLRGYDSAQALAQVLTQRYCTALANPELTSIGWHREGSAWWVLLAARFTPPQPGDAAAVAM